MIRLRSWALAFAGAILSVSVASSQIGEIDSGHVLANSSAASREARGTSGTAWFDRWCSSTNSTMLQRQGGSWVCSATLTGLTLTSPVINAPDINGGTADALTSLGIRSTGAAFDLRFATAEALSADRVLSWVLGNANRTISLAGNIATGGAFTLSGAFASTFTFTNTTTVTFPTTGTLATLAGAETLTNKTFTAGANDFAIYDSLFLLQDNSDPTKRLNFQLSSIATGTTRTWTWPDASDTVVGLTASQTLTNKTLTSPTINTPTISGGTHDALTSLGIRSTGAAFDLRFAATEVFTANRTLTWILNDAARTINLGGNITTGGAFTLSGAFASTFTFTGTTTVTFPTAGTLATLGGSETLTNKTIGNSNALTLLDTLFTLQDNADTTKQLLFQLSSIATGTTRTWTWPDASDTVVGLAATQTLTGKTYDTLGAGNVFRISGVQLSAVTGTGAVVLASGGTLAAPITTGIHNNQGAWQLSGDSSPAQITSNQNNYNPSSVVCSTASTLRINSDAARDITGMAGGIDGCEMNIVNVGSFAITLKDNSGSSTAANQFQFGADLVIASKQGAKLWYDSTTAGWRQTFVGGSGGGSGTVTQVIVAAGDGIGVTGTCTITTSGTCTVASAVKSAFSVHNNGTAQTGIVSATDTQITWSTELYDVGGNFASSTWTPPAGKVHMNFSFFATGTITAGGICAVIIYKNGAAHKQNTMSCATGGAFGGVGVDDIANGTDAYTTRVYITTSSGTASTNGASSLTWWTGHWIGPRRRRREIGDVTRRRRGRDRHQVRRCGRSVALAQRVA